MLIDSNPIDTKYFTIFDFIRDDDIETIRDITDINILNESYVVNGHKFTPMEYAAYIGNLDVVNILYLNGALLSGNALVWAAKNGNLNVLVKIFPFVCDISISVKVACSFAAVNGHNSIVDFLCQNYCFDTEFKIKLINLAKMNGYQIGGYVTNRM